MLFRSLEILQHTRAEYGNIELGTANGFDEDHQFHNIVDWDVFEDEGVDFLILFTREEREEKPRLRLVKPTPSG